MLRYPHGADPEILKIYLEYSDILIRKGIGSYNIWMKRAHYLYALGRMEDAVMAVDEALTYKPADVEAFFLKGVCLQLLALRESGDGFDGPLVEASSRLLKQAKGCFEAVLVQNPDDHEAMAFLTNIRCLLYSPMPASRGDLPEPVGATA